MCPLMHLEMTASLQETLWLWRTTNAARSLNDDLRRGHLDNDFSRRDVAATAGGGCNRTGQLFGSHFENFDLRILRAPRGSHQQQGGSEKYQGRQAAEHLA